VQQALRVGKRVHSETGIDTVSRSLVERALDLSGNMLGDLTGVRAVVVGAGAMSSLATHTLVRHGLGEVTVVNRTFDAARRL
ncbi:MAG TPA: glutamyl-tRNA reductase, partial [Dermacoccus sp.]|nr:glutamyl-tRNA reductase [Dermacoccus sp.]